MAYSYVSITGEGQVSLGFNGGPVAYGDATGYIFPASGYTIPVLELNDSSGSISVQSPGALAAGSYSFDFFLSSNATIYSGGSGTTTTTPSSLQLEIDVSSVAVNLTSTANPSTYGQPVDLAATVSPAGSGQPTPTGTVTFMDGANPLGPPVALDDTGTATLPFSTLTAGTHSITAVYNGDTNYTGTSSSLPLTQVVNQATPTVYVQDAGGTYDGMPFPATATVAGVVPGVDDTPAPSLEGVSPTLTYYDANGNPLSGAPSAVGTYTVVATFPGSADYTSATSSAPATFVIAPTPTPTPTPTPPPPATQLAITTPPPASVGLYNTFDVKVTAEDANGNPVTNYKGPVTISLGNSPPSSTFGGTLTEYAVNGVADFPDLSLSLASTNYTLEATSPGLSAAVTVPFTVACTPAQIRAAYGLSNLPTSWTGAGQTIAIVGVGDDPTLQSDLNQFDTTFQLPALTIPKINSSGQTTNLPPAGSAVYQNEEAMDVEWAHAIAPGASIVLVEANPNTSFPSNINPFNIPDFFSAVQEASSYPGVSVVSMSLDYYLSSAFISVPYWISQGFDNLYFNVTGVTFVASSGDSGSALAYPAMSPDVVSVGGTSLHLNADNTYDYETDWSDSGGGVASAPGLTSEPQPSYQNGVQNTGYRAFPDVAFDADPNTGVYVYSSINSSNPSQDWIDMGGTSLAAPCWAAILAIVNAERSAPFSNSVQALTALYDVPRSNFNEPDVVRYNEVIGLGTPIASSLVSALTAWQPITLAAGPLQAETVGTFQSQAIMANGGTGKSTLTVTPLWSNYPTGLSFNNTNNNELDITGTPTAAGTYPFSVTATDSNGFTAAQSYTLIINAAATTTALVSSANPSVYGQSVTFTATVAAVAPGAGTATGSIEFFDGPAALATVPLSGGSASFSASFLVVGTQALSAQYLGDSNFSGSTSSGAHPGCQSG